MSPTDGPPLPDPKARALDRPRKPYRRKVASRRQFERICAEKLGPCLVCTHRGIYNGHDLGRIEFHHVVSRQDGGDDVADNIVPLHHVCHDRVTRRDATVSRALLTALTDAEYSYAIERGGEGYFERAYGVEYSRP